MSGGHTGGDARLAVTDLRGTFLLQNLNACLTKLEELADEAQDPSQRHCLRDAVPQLRAFIRMLEAVDQVNTAETERDRLEQLVREAVADYDRRTAHWWGRFLMWLIRRTT